MAERILLVEDDPRLADMLSEYLGQAGYRVTVAPLGAAALAHLAGEEYDAVVLDLMLPDMDGLDICRELRTQSDTPVLMLTGRGDAIDRIVGLELGADDYLAKPCNPRELLARVRAVLRRKTEARGTEEPLEAACEFAGWRLDLVRHELRSPQSVVVNLSSGEFSLLRAFVERPQRVLTRDQLLEFARGPRSEAFDRAIDVQISRLRRKLEGGGDGQELIRTIRNEGYLFVPRVSRTP